MTTKLTLTIFKHRLLSAGVHPLTGSVRDLRLGEKVIGQMTAEGRMTAELRPIYAGLLREFVGVR